MFLADMWKPLPINNQQSASHAVAVDVDTVIRRSSETEDLPELHGPVGELVWFKFLNDTHLRRLVRRVQEVVNCAV